MRKKKAVINFGTSMLQELVTLICGLILPRLILVAFGTKYNGIISSITQFLQVVALLRAGVGGVTRAALYKPIAEGDTLEISRIVRATEIFMRKIVGIFGIMLIGMALIYPLFVIDEFSWLFSASLVLILGVSTLAQYYFGITYQMLLQADQRQYINSVISIVSMIANTLVAVVLIKLGSSIHAVKLGSSIVYSINPIVIYFYVRKRYRLIKDVEPDNTAIKQRWDAFIHQVAAFIHNNTDVILITIFCNISEVSVYSIYHMISYNVKVLVNSFSSGISAAFGDMIAKKEFAILRKNVSMFELLMCSVSAVIFSCTAILIVPFVSLYTQGINDYNYIRPLFGYLIVLSELLYCIRIPYQSVVEAAGHFKQTRNGALSEALINVLISLIMVKKWGIIGVVVGTIVAMVFRTVQYAVYMNHNILKISCLPFIKRVIILALNIMATVLAGNVIPMTGTESYTNWIIYAVILVILASVITIFLNYIFYSSDMSSLLNLVFSILKKNNNRKELQ
jgi:O-antigen/teichoic acid export membrane protein